MEEEIMKDNKNNIILSEEELCGISGGRVAGAAWTQKGMTYYRIARGDTLQDIAVRFHTSSEAIKALNPILLKSLDSGIHEGQEIRIS